MYFSQKQWLKRLRYLLSNVLQTCSFSLHKLLIDVLELCGLLVNCGDVLSAVLALNSDGTHSLQRIHWCASGVMQNFSKPVLMKKQTHLHIVRHKGE